MAETTGCPHCAETMDAGDEGRWFVCPSCGHVTVEGYPSYRCSCKTCIERGPMPNLVVQGTRQFLQRKRYTVTSYNEPRREQSFSIAVPVTWSAGLISKQSQTIPHGLLRSSFGIARMAKEFPWSAR